MVGECRREKMSACTDIPFVAGPGLAEPRTLSRCVVRNRILGVKILISPHRRCRYVEQACVTVIARCIAGVIRAASAFQSARSAVTAVIGSQKASSQSPVRPTQKDYTGMARTMTVVVGVGKLRNIAVRSQSQFTARACRRIRNPAYATKVRAGKVVSQLEALAAGGRREAIRKTPGCNRKCGARQQQ